MPGAAPSLWRTFGAGLGALFAAPAQAEEARGPLELDAGYTSDSFANAGGGRKRGLAQMGLLELSLGVDGADLGLEGARFFASAQWVHGSSLSDRLAGDGQVASNIDAPDGVRPFEAWMSFPVTAKSYVKAGLVDLNGEFDVQQVGSLFLNSSHGIGPDFSQSGRNGPSIFPTTSTAVVAGWSDERWSLRFGLFDAVAGDPDRPRRTVVRFPGQTGLLLVGEADLRVKDSALIRVGAWTYTTRFETLPTHGAGTMLARRGNRGLYAMAEGTLGRVGGKPLRGWVRAGLAEAEINPIAQYLGGGMALGEEGEGWGIAVARASLGESALGVPGQPRPRRAETNVELTYAWVVSDRLTIQPDLQYVFNPGWDRRAGDAILVGTRLSLSLF